MREETRWQIWVPPDYIYRCGVACGRRGKSGHGVGAACAEACALLTPSGGRNKGSAKCGRRSGSAGERKGQHNLRATRKVRTARKVRCAKCVVQSACSGAMCNAQCSARARAFVYTIVWCTGGPRDLQRIVRSALAAACRARARAHNAERARSADASGCFWGAESTGRAKGTGQSRTGGKCVCCAGS